MNIIPVPNVVGRSRRKTNQAGQGKEAIPAKKTSALGTGKAKIMISGDNKFKPRRQLGGKGMFATGKN